MPLSNKLSNIIGVPLPNFVREQLYSRSNLHSKQDRDTNDILALGNKTGWIRVISSVNLTLPQDVKYFRNLGADIHTQGDAPMNLNEESSLSQGFVLFGGVSAYHKDNNDQTAYDLKYGLGTGGAYGMLGPQEIKKYGYRPMPGITSAKIVTQGKLGSVRSAEIQFKAWDRHQLDIIDALYFKLGFSMFIEWGATTFYDSDNRLKKGEDYAIDVFSKTNIDDIRKDIYKNVANSGGNYDAMLGIVTNFNYTFSQNGGYDCSIKVISLGILAESMKINKPSNLPEVLKDDISKVFNSLILLKKQAEEAKLAAEKRKEEEAIAKAQQQADAEASKNGIVLYHSFEQWESGRKKEVKENKGILKEGKSSNGGKYLIYKSAYNKVKEIAINNGKNIKGFFNIEKKMEATIEFNSNINAAIKNYIKAYNAANPSEKLIAEYWEEETTNLGTTYKVQSSIDMEDYYITRNNNGFAPFYNAFLSRNVTTLGIDVGNTKRGRIRIQGDNDSSIDNAKERFYSTRKNSELISFNIGNQGFSYTVNISTTGIIQDENANANSISPNLYYITDNNTFRGVIQTANDLINNPSTKYILETETDQEYNSVEEFNDEFENKFLPISSTGAIRFKTSVAKEILIKTTASSLSGGSATETLIKKTVLFPIWIATNDLGLLTSIKELKDNPLGDAQQLTPDAQATEESKPPTIEDVQKNEALRYRSSIELLLRAIQLRHISKAAPNIGVNENGEYTNSKVNLIDLSEKQHIDFTRQLFSKGAFSKYIDQLIEGKIDDSIRTNNELLVSLKYGFNFNMMKDWEGFFDKIQIANLSEDIRVDYAALMRTYLIPYKVSKTLSNDLALPAYPVYVTLGFFFFALNHMCVLYNENKPEDGRPLVYIDFNNKTNFCLSNSLSFSTDPTKFFIPFEGTQADYKRLFDKDSLTEMEKNKVIFNPDPNADDKLSAFITPKYRYTLESSKESTYRGNIMNVFVNVDYLLDVISNFTKQDEENNVYLKQLLETIVSDLNKSTGNINIFRLAYNDYANTYHISDDQVMPTLSSEDSISTVPLNTYGSRYGELPLYGNGSIAKTLDIKTEISTRLSNMIAISANSQMTDKVAASKDSTSVGYLNVGFKDRYKSKIVDEVKNIVTGSTNRSNIDAAVQFNNIVKNTYGNTYIDENGISQAIGYYIDRMNKIKSSDPPTRATAMIPLSLNFSTDGISGMSMGHSFTIQDELLPYSYVDRKVPNDHSSVPKKVGFVIIGVDHEISNNKWTTSVRSNMFFLKASDDYKNGNLVYRKTNIAPTLNSENTSTVVYNTNATPVLEGQYYKTRFVATGADSITAKQVADTYLGRSLSIEEWNNLVATTYAESTKNQEENAHVMGVILNRLRAGTWGNSILSVINAKSQFQSVTGTKVNPGPSSMFTNGPEILRAQNIYGAVTLYIGSVPKKYQHFTAANSAAYGPGTNIGFRDTLINQGGIKIGGTIFAP